MDEHSTAGFNMQALRSKELCSLTKCNQRRKYSDFKANYFEVHSGTQEESQGL